MVGPARVDIRQVYGVVPNSVPNALNNPVDPDVIDIFRGNDDETDIEIILHAALSLYFQTNQRPTIHNVSATEPNQRMTPQMKNERQFTHRHLLPNPHMNIRILDHQPFLVRDEEVTPVCHWVRLRWCRYAFGASGVEMRVEMDDGDAVPVEFVERTQGGKDYRMVTTEAGLRGFILCDFWGIRETEEREVNVTNTYVTILG